MTDNLFTIRYSCGDVRQYPREGVTREMSRALFRVPCPDPAPSVRPSPLLSDTG